MEFTNYIRKPFIVEAVEITLANIEECAPLIGTLAHKEDGTPYIQVDQKKVPNLSRVHIGFMMTRVNGSIRCYTRKFFRSQFVIEDDNIRSWVDYLNGEPAQVTSTPA